jgi:type VI secretion system FHA domain protein
VEVSPFDVAQSPPPAAAEALRDPLDFDDPLASVEETHWSSAAEPISAPPVVAAPVVRQRTPRPAGPSNASPLAPPFEADPFNESEALPARQPVPPPAQHLPPRAPDLGASPFDEPSDPPRSEPVSVPVTARASPPVRPIEPPKAAVAVPASDTGGALAAFFKGAELGDASPADPIAMMTGLGEAFRALVSGLRQVLIARATIKGEFRIEQTMIRARGNNPLKFSANDDDALTALLGVGRRTDMAPAAAIEDSLRDLRMHEVATMAAMQVAVRAMLDELSPDKIRAGTDQGGMAVLPAQRKARAWDGFEARHAQVVRALVDDFDSIFGKSFARAYERALDEISTRDRQ